MNKYLFLFTIGPVQSFISQARKTHDLYAGSKLLSNLTAIGMEQLKKSANNPQIIFPSEGIESNPNRFIAIVEKDSDDEMKELGKSIEISVKEHFKTLANNAFSILNKETKPSNFNNQINDFLQIYWTAIPYNNYKEDYEYIETLLGSIKNIKPFNQIDEQGRKCSLCGERNVLFYKSGNSGRPAYIQNDAINVYEGRIGIGEGLCSVCYTKRFYDPESNEFPSTADIAVMNTLYQLSNKNNDNYVLLDNYKKMLKQLKLHKKILSFTQSVVTIGYRYAI